MKGESFHLAKCGDGRVHVFFEADDDTAPRAQCKAALADTALPAGNDPMCRDCLGVVARHLGLSPTDLVNLGGAA